MKVLLINGGPHEKGCTYTALKEVAGAIAACGVETEILWLGNGPIQSCRGCDLCRRSADGKCFADDHVNEVAARADEFGGFVFGSPTHYGGASGTITAFMGRLFHSAGARFRNKAAAGVTVCRRAGTLTALDQINRCFDINGMVAAGSTYWNVTFGMTPGGGHVR
jgi:multimeric flavodoxin WrbA